MNWIIWGSAAASIAVVVSAIHRTRKIAPLSARMGSPTWDFGQSWASTFAGASALVGGALSSQLLSDAGLLLPRGSYVSLAAFFAALAILAPMFYASAREAVKVAVDPSKPARTEQYQGRVGAYFIAGAITLWAFFGQAFLAGLLFAEIRAAGWLPSAAAGTLQALLSITALLTAFYASSSLTSTVRQQKTASDQGRARILGVGSDAAPALPSWPLL